eukprot:TRINITY_DN5803_c0_g1_i2.p1 TRINITY_DN5803_c0_g1~~TRINITY_DN5803_c0_g1_i2.p1  ORF type:complete len:533 (+),score=88.18 TRINITY_DN5803_c0_g1_i2:26-1600(+)
MTIILLVLVCLLCLHHDTSLLYASGATYNFNPTTGANQAWYSRLNNLQPGDRVVFASGTPSYALTSKISVNIKGTAAAPIIIECTDATPAIFPRSDASQNIWDIDGSYFTLRNLAFTGGSKGLRFGAQGNVTNVNLENIKVYDTEETGVTFNDGNRDYSNIRITGTEVYNTGSGTSECFYFGCQNAACQMHDSVIDGNFCHDTLNADSGYGSGIQLKTGSYSNQITNNVCWKTRGPGILAYDDYNRGVNTIVGNYIVEAGDQGIQVTAGAVLANNIIVDSFSNGIGIINNQVMAGSTPRNLRIVQNTVVNDAASGTCLYLANAVNSATVVVANNALFCPNGNAYAGVSAVGSNFKSNGYIGGSFSGTGGNTGATFVLDGIGADLVNAATADYYPSATSKLINRGDASSSSYTYNVDYNCVTRSASTPTVGAYQYTSPNDHLSFYTGQTPTFKTACQSSSTTTSSSSSSTTTATSPTTATSSSSSPTTTTTTSSVPTTSSQNGSGAGTSVLVALNIVVLTILILM